MIRGYFAQAICRFFIYLSAVTIINHFSDCLGPRKSILAESSVRVGSARVFVSKPWVSMKQVCSNIFLTRFYLSTPVTPPPPRAASENVRLLLLKLFLFFLCSCRNQVQRGCLNCPGSHSEPERAGTRTRTCQLFLPWSEVVLPWKGMSPEIR